MAISIGKLAIHLTTETAGMVAGFGKASKIVKAFSASIGGSGGGAGGGGAGAGGGGAAAALGGVSLGAVAATAAITATVAALGRLAYKGIEFAAGMELAKASFTGFLGSADAANSMIKDLFSFAATTPFEFPEVQGAAKTLIAMGTAGEDVMGHMRMLGEVASGSTQPLGEVAEVFGQVMQAGRLTGNELKQFNMRGIPLLSELAKMLDVPKEKIRDLVEAGEISSAQVVQAFANMTTGTGLFTGQMDKQAATLIGQWATFKDNLFALAGDIMAYVTPALTEMLRITNSIIESIRGTTRETQADREASIHAAAAKAKALQEVTDATRKAKEEAEKIAAEQKKQADEMKSRADQLTKSLRTPAEVWQDSMREINDLLKAGLITWDTYTRGVEEATQALERSFAAGDKQAKAFGPETSVGAVLKGTAAARSAEFAASGEMKRLAEQSRQQTELARQAKQQRAAMLKALEKKPIEVREVTI